MNAAIQEGSARNDDSFCENCRPAFQMQNDPACASVLFNPDRCAFCQIEKLGRPKEATDSGLIELSISLRARPPNSWPLRPVQQSELNSGFIRRAPHNTVKRIDLPNQVTFPQPTDGRVAGHFPNG
jgi:hypothetical protein